MTRKDYVMIAEAIRESLQTIRRELQFEGLNDHTRAILTGESAGIKFAALRLADTLRQDNPRFEWKRFMQACGFDMD